MALAKYLLVFTVVCIVSRDCFIRNTYLRRIRNGMSNRSVFSSTCDTELDCLTDTLTKAEGIYLSMVIHCNCQRLGNGLYNKKSRWKIIFEKDGTYSKVPQNLHTGPDAETTMVSSINDTRVNTTKGSSPKGRVREGVTRSPPETSSVEDTIHVITRTVHETSVVEDQTTVVSGRAGETRSPTETSVVEDKTTVVSGRGREGETRSPTETSVVEDQTTVVSGRGRAGETRSPTETSVVEDQTTVVTGRAGETRSPTETSVVEDQTTVVGTNPSKSNRFFTSTQTPDKAGSTKVQKLHLSSTAHSGADANMKAQIAKVTTKENIADPMTVSTVATVTGGEKTQMSDKLHQPGHEETDVKNDHSLLVMDAENKAVYQFLLPKRTNVIQIDFPKKDDLVNVEFCPFYDGLKWISKREVHSSSLKDKAPKKIMQMHWSQGSLLTVKYSMEKKLIFYVTTTGIYRVRWKTTERPRLFARKIKPVHVELDKKKRYIYWTEQKPGSVAFKKVRYEGASMLTEFVIKKKEVYGFSIVGRYDHPITGGRFTQYDILCADHDERSIYFCGPTPHIRQGGKNGKVRDIKENCLHIIRHGVIVYILAHSSKVIVLDMTTSKTESWNLPRHITSGHLQFVGNDEKKVTEDKKHQRKKPIVQKPKRRGKSRQSHRSPQSKTSSRREKRKSKHTPTYGRTSGRYGTSYPRRNGGSQRERFLLMMDARNRLVSKISLLDIHFQQHIYLPQGDRIRDIEYSARERKILWISAYQIIKTPLISNLQRSDMSTTRWVKQDALLTVKIADRRIFFCTHNDIVKAHMPFTEYSNVYPVTRVRTPLHVTLDTKQEYVFWTEWHTYISVNRVPFSGHNPQTVTNLKALTGFTIDPTGIMYLCSPSPVKLDLKSSSKPMYVWGRATCSDIATNGYTAYILVPPSTLILARTNGDPRDNGRQFTLNTRVEKGFLRILD